MDPIFPMPRAQPMPLARIRGDVNVNAVEGMAEFVEVSDGDMRLLSRDFSP